MSEPEHTTPKKWHESAAQAFEAIAVVVIVTSPCWGFALIAWVTK